LLKAPKIVLHFRSAVLAAITITLLTGCESKISQCQKIIKIHNNIVLEAKKVSDTGTKGDTSSASKSAEAFAQGAKEMTSLEVRDEKLAEIKNQLATMYQNSSQVTKQILASQAQKKSTEAAKGLENLKQVASPEKDLVDGINSYCSEGRKTEATTSPSSSSK
jgi:galactokinase/mevalonate kinase-like predicted kinase